MLQTLHFDQFHCWREGKKRSKPIKHTTYLVGYMFRVASGYSCVLCAFMFMHIKCYRKKVLQSSIGRNSQEGALSQATLLHTIWAIKPLSQVDEVACNKSYPCMVNLVCSLMLAPWWWTNFLVLWLIVKPQNLVGFVQKWDITVAQ